MNNKIDLDYEEQRTSLRTLERLIVNCIKRRKLLGLSQRELAINSGFSVSTIKKWESLEQYPNSFALLCWMECLGIKMYVRFRKIADKK